MINDDLSGEHLGGGVVLFRDAIRVNQDLLMPYLEDRYDRAIREEFVVIHDDEGNPLHAINRSGHRYALKDVHKVNRIMNFSSGTSSQEVIEEFEKFESTIYSHLLKYAERFPMVLPSLWWREQGHVAAYRENGEMGYHSDNDVNYKPGHIPDLQLATRHVVGAILYLNDSVESIDEVSGYEYVGGELEFAYLGIKHSPRSGDLIIFPSNYLAAHRVNTVKSGTRYAYIGYFSHGSEDVKRGVSPAEKLEQVVSGQVWMHNLFSDYEKYLISKYGENLESYEHLTMPLFRPSQSSDGTTEESLRERAKNDQQ